MQLFQVDDAGALFISPALIGWAPLQELGIDTVIDLEGGVDHCIPTVPNHVLYVYFPIYDEDLPNLAKLNAVADMGAGLILLRLGVSGPDGVRRLRACRPGALFNQVFAAHLESLTALDRAGG